jgi:hypothetical protein
MFVYVCVFFCVCVQVEALRWANHPSKESYRLSLIKKQETQPYAPKREQAPKCGSKEEEKNVFLCSVNIEVSAQRWNRQLKGQKCDNVPPQSGYDAETRTLSVESYSGAIASNANAATWNRTRGPAIWQHKNRRISWHLGFSWHWPTIFSEQTEDW